MSSNLEPFQQGEFDGLCAVYSVINAIRLVISARRRLTYPECCLLFKSAIQYIDDKGNLAEVMTKGTNFIFWFGIQRHLCKVASEMTGIRIKIVRPFKSSKGVTLEQLKSQTLLYLNQGNVCLLALAGSYKHYTVIRRATHSRIWLFDSFSYNWVDWSNMRISSKEGTDPHIFRPSSLSGLLLKLDQ